MRRRAESPRGCSGEGEGGGDNQPKMQGSGRPPRFPDGGEGRRGRGGKGGIRKI